ncbi:MAG: GNAT family N-acetyltransferase [Methanomassiliicoccaceae archaeon]|jgi:GNAT superfamily N-acetyltransferase|nr:GNAT family N-acetyltransferase [Methanomassiliicoccaceae archaeon]
MTGLNFPVDGHRLRMAGDDDMAFIMDCMRRSILLSVPDDEAKHSDLWMDDILNVTSIAMDGGMMRSELFVLEDHHGSREGMLWMGISRDQFTCEETGYLLGVFVNEELRGKGLGKALMGCAGDWCVEKGLLSMTLNVGFSNRAAMSMYGHLGFEERSTVMRRRFR